MNKEDLQEEQGIVTKLPAVNDQIQTNQLISHYIFLYHKRYKVEPVLPNDYSQTLTMAMIQKSAGSRAFALLEQFFKMDPDGWYSKQGHSIACLKSSINAVNAALGQKEPKTIHGGIRIRTLFACDGCFKHFSFECNPSVFDSGVDILCPECSRGK